MESIQSISQVVRNNEHPVPMSIVDRMKAVNITRIPEETQVITLTNDVNESMIAIHHEEIIGGSISNFIQNVKRNSGMDSIKSALGSAILDLAPIPVGIPGETGKSEEGNNETFEDFNNRIEAFQNMKFYDETVPMIATIGAAGALAFYVMTAKKPQKRK